MEHIRGSDGVHVFESYELSPVMETLHRKGRRIPLRPQAVRVLTLLVSNAGEVVTREELRDHVWGPDTFVDHVHGLNNCIRTIRSALGDDAATPQFLLTVTGRGYRFIAPVRWVSTSDRRPRWTIPLHRKLRRWAWLAGGLVLGLTAALLLASRFESAVSPASPLPRRLVVVCAFADAGEGEGAVVTFSATEEDPQAAGDLWIETCRRLRAELEGSTRLAGS